MAAGQEIARMRSSSAAARTVSALECLADAVTIVDDLGETGVAGVHLVARNRLAKDTTHGTGGRGAPADRKENSSNTVRNYQKRCLSLQQMSQIERYIRLNAGKGGREKWAPRRGGSSEETISTNGKCAFKHLRMMYMEKDSLIS